MRKVISSVLILTLMLGCLSGGIVAAGDSGKDSAAVMLDFNSTDVITAFRMTPDTKNARSAKYAGEWDITQSPEAITAQIPNGGDLSGYSGIRFAVKGEKGKPVEFLFRLLSKNLESPNEDYYSVKKFVIDSDEWQEITIEFASMSKGRNPQGFDHIDRLELFSHGWDVVNENGGKLYFDTFYLLEGSAPTPVPTPTPFPTLAPGETYPPGMNPVGGSGGNEEDTVLYDFNDVSNITSISLKPNTAYTKNAKQSGEWGLMEKSAITMNNITHDFTPYSEVRFWVYGNSALPATFMFRLLSNNEDTEGDDYYSQQITVKKDGWQEIVLPIANLSVSRSPRGLDQVDCVQFISSGWGMVNDPNARLYIDTLYLGNRTPKPVPTSDPNDKSVISDAICLMLDAPYALVNGERKMIDSTNRNVVPFTSNDRTLVPIRFIGEALGATVDYAGGAEEKVTIHLGSDTIELTIGSNTIVINGTPKQIDTAAITTGDDRTFVPLRACAEAFGKEVLWDEMGFIAITDDLARLQEKMNRETGLALMTNVISDMVYDRPSGEQMLSDLKAVSKSAHPRLFATQQDFETILENAKTDATLAAWIEKFKGKADGAMDPTLPVYHVGERQTLELTSSPKDRIVTLAALYRFTGEEKYAARAYQEMEALCNFPDWHPGHFLDTSSLMQGMAIGYDWLYDYLSPTQRKTIEEGIYKHGIYAAKTAYEGTTEGMEPLHGSFGRSGWAKGTNNWNAVCNAGVMEMALALADVYPEECASLFGNAISSIELGVKEYAPDGGYPEGPSYWGYGTSHLVLFMAAMDKAMGTTYGIFNTPGLSQTGYYTSYVESNQGMWNYHDCGEGYVGTDTLFWFANKLNNPDLAGLRLQRINGGQQTVTLRDILWYNPSNINTEVHMPLDKAYDGIDTVTMRSSWNDSGAVFTGLHGGSNSVSHGNLDMGNFILDASGERWIEDLGTENYNLPGYFSGGAGGQRWTYYRLRAEGQNTIVIDPDEDGGQSVNARSKIASMQSKAKGGYATLDLKPGYGEKVKEMTRGVWLTDNRRAVVVQDEITLTNPSEVWWFAHTKADIELATDGRSAILTKNGKRMHVQIVSPMTDAKFTVMDAAPLPTSPEANPNEYGKDQFRKLAIHMSGVTEYNLAVVFRALDIGKEKPEFTYTFTPMNSWTIPDGEIVVPQLSDLTIDGQTVAGFSPLATDYKVVLPFGTTAIPQIGASADGYQVEITQATEMPGVASVKVTDPADPSVYNIYTVLVRAAKEIEVEASAYQEGNPPENSIDGNMETRWSAEGEEWIMYTFASPRELSSVWVACWQSSEKRKTMLEIQISGDGENFKTVYSGQTRATKEELEEFPFEKTVVKAVKIIGRGNTTNDWNSILEVDFR